MSVREWCDCDRDGAVSACQCVTCHVSPCDHLQCIHGPRLKAPAPGSVSWAQLGTLHIGDSWSWAGAGLVLGWCGLTVSPTVITLVSLSPYPAQPSHAATLGS